jgi:hypothetical protein
LIVQNAARYFDLTQDAADWPFKSGFYLVFPAAKLALNRFPGKWTLAALVKADMAEWRRRKRPWQLLFRTTYPEILRIRQTQ